MARRAGDYAVVGVAALVTLDEGGHCQRARVALCGVGPTPVRALDAEGALTGKMPVGAALDEAAARAAVATQPASDLHGSAEFRRKLARHFTRLAIQTATARAGARPGGGGS
jgi:aerobic carbon-monoxide dehydrogenase medium subunit